MYSTMTASISEPVEGPPGLIIFFLYLLVAYLIGTIPFGLILAKLCGHGDIRKIGSGNIGATNVLRTGSKPLALATLFLDAIKGAIFIGVLSFIATSPSAPRNDEHYAIILAIGLFAVIGHCFPVWLKFKGGKGVATALGIFLAATPLAGLAAIGAWIVTALISKTSSLSALVAVLIAPIVTFFIYGQTPALVAFLITALIWWRHKDNIKRLIKGEEPKISFKKEK